MMERKSSNQKQKQSAKAREEEFLKYQTKFKLARDNKEQKTAHTKGESVLKASRASKSLRGKK